MSVAGSRRLMSVVGFIAFSLAAGSVQAQTRSETLRYVTGASVNTLDPNIPGSTREAFAVSLSTYDRLVSFGRKQLNGKWVFDLGKITGELAESYDVSPDGLKMTFHLRKDAKFQDGTPVTAEDVKWSLDRVVTAPVLGKAQLLTGSMTSADQFKVIDSLTFEVTLPKPDKLALPNLATVYPIIFNSKVAKEHATAEDPWATAWLKEHTAGSGAYVIDTFKPGEQVIMTRNEAWNRGTADKSAFFKRVIVQSVPEPATRANLVERGDADIVVDLQASDVQSLEAKGKLKVISTPQYNAVTFISMNNQIPPFDNINVRRAIAYALPYDDMFKAALFGRGSPLFGATWADGKPSSGAYPIPQPVKLDLDKAKDYLKAAGLPDGFSTTSRSASRSISRSCRMRRCRRRSMRRSFPSSPRASLPGCPRPTISTAISTPAISAGTTHRSIIPNWWRSRRRPVSKPTRSSTRKTAKSSTPSISARYRRYRSGSPARTR